MEPIDFSVFAFFTTGAFFFLIASLFYGLGIIQDYKDFWQQEEEI